MGNGGSARTFPPPAGGPSASKSGYSMAQEAPSRQQVGARGAQLAGGTAAQHEPPPALVGIVEMLHGVEDGRHVLCLVHHDRGGAARLRQRPAPLNQQIGIAQVLGSLGGPGEIQPDRRLRQEFAQQRGLAGLARAEHQLHVRRGELLLPDRFDPPTEHVACFTNGRLVQSQLSGRPHPTTWFPSLTADKEERTR